MIVGVYGTNAAQLASVRSELDATVRVIELAPEHEGADGLASAHARQAARQHLLDASQHVIVLGESLEAIGLFTGALRRLVVGRLDSLTLVATIDPDPLLAAGEPDEWEAARQALADRRLCVGSTLATDRLREISDWGVRAREPSLE